MKKFIAVMAFAFFATLSAFAQGKDYKVVFDLTSKDTVDHQNVLRWIDLILKDNPDAQLEVVFYGQSLELVTKDKSVNQASIERLAANKNVSFSVCRIAMKKHNIDVSQLIPGVQTVPDGIYEIITKEKAGWGYIKVAH